MSFLQGYYTGLKNVTGIKENMSPYQMWGIFDTIYAEVSGCFKYTGIYQALT